MRPGHQFLQYCPLWGCKPNPSLLSRLIGFVWWKAQETEIISSEEGFKICLESDLSIFLLFKKKSVSLIISLGKQVERGALKLQGNNRGSGVFFKAAGPRGCCAGPFVSVVSGTWVESPTLITSLEPSLFLLLVQVGRRGNHQMGRALSSLLPLSYPFNTFWRPAGFSQVLMLRQWFSRLFELCSGREQDSPPNPPRTSPFLPKNTDKKPNYDSQRVK